MPDKRLVALIY